MIQLSTTPVRAHVFASEQTSQPLLLKAADGPWNWTEAQFELLAGAPSDLHATTLGSAALRTMHSLGVLTATAEGEDGVTTYSFKDEEPLRLAGASFDEAGTGYRVWSSALALALFTRSSASPPLPANPSVLELGAGVGLPGLDFGQRMKGRARVTLTDSRPALLSLMQQNAARLNMGRDATGERQPGWMQVRRLEWGSGGRVKDGVFFQEDSENSIDQINPHPGAFASGHGLDRGRAEGARGGRGDELGQYDLVLGSDVCYLPEDVAALTQLLLDLGAPVRGFSGGGLACVEWGA